MEVKVHFKEDEIKAQVELTAVLVVVMVVHHKKEGFLLLLVIGD